MAAVLFTLLPVFPLQSQTLAVLERGPVYGEGAPGISDPLVPVWEGEYLDGERVYRIWFSTTELSAAQRFIPEYSWSTGVPCTLPAALLQSWPVRYSAVSGDGSVQLLFMEHSEGFWFVFQLPIPGADKSASLSRRNCQFVQVFLTRFLYFRNIKKTVNLPNFPALLDQP